MTIKELYNLAVSLKSRTLSYTQEVTMVSLVAFMT